jgi:hypothetical protein
MGLEGHNPASEEECGNPLVLGSEIQLRILKTLSKQMSTNVAF